MKTPIFFRPSRNPRSTKNLLEAIDLPNSSALALSLLLLTRDIIAIDQYMKTILVVDDDWVLRRKISEFLRHRGYQVYEARDADAAIDLMMRRYFDVAISALRLPGTTSGTDALKHHALSVPKGTRVLVSEFGTSQIQAEAKVVGATCMAKPIVFNELLRKIPQC